MQPTNCVRNLGYIYDAELKNNSHINKLVSTCYVTLRRISGIGNLLDYDTCKIWVQALVLAKVDYCNKSPSRQFSVCVRQTTEDSEYGC